MILEYKNKKLLILRTGFLGLFIGYYTPDFSKKILQIGNPVPKRE